MRKFHLPKAHFVSPSKRVKPQLSQTLIKNTRPYSNSRSTIQISYPFPSYFSFEPKMCSLRWFFKLRSNFLLIFSLWSFFRLPLYNSTSLWAVALKRKLNTGYYHKQNCYIYIYIFVNRWCLGQFTRTLTNYPRPWN